MYDFRQITLQELTNLECCGDYPSCQLKWISIWFSTFKNVENNVFGYEKKPFIVAAYLKDVLVAVVPLMKLSRVFCKCIRLEFVEFLDQQWCSMGNDVIAIKSLNESFADELIPWIKKNINFHFLFFKYLPKTSILTQKFRLFHYAGSPFVRLLDYSNYEEFSSQVYSRRFREDLRKRLRKIKREGFELEISYEPITDRNLEEIRRIAKSKETDGKHFLYANSEKEHFHLQVYKNFPSQVAFIKLNKQTVAYGTCIDWNGERIGVDAAFDRDYRSYGVGIHCADSIIRRSFKDEKQKISFGMGLDTYKFQFTNQIETFYMCFDFKYRLKALLALPCFLYLLKKEDQKVLEKLQNIQADV